MKKMDAEKAIISSDVADVMSFSFFLMFNASSFLFDILNTHAKHVWLYHDNVSMDFNQQYV